MPEPPRTTPDGRYIIVGGQLWRASNPALRPEDRQFFVDRLMEARRAVREALRGENKEALRWARAQVQAAKEALGERGDVWWSDGAPDCNRRRIENTVYAEWWDQQRALSPGGDTDEVESVASG